jgi:hypothetical protein
MCGCKCIFGHNDPPSREFKICNLQDNNFGISRCISLLRTGLGGLSFLRLQWGESMRGSGFEWDCLDEGREHRAAEYQNGDF